jgi:hypothetical protein
MSRSRSFLSLRCKEGGWRERNKESARGGEGKKKRVCVSEGEGDRGGSSERVSERGSGGGRGKGG